MHKRRQAKLGNEFPDSLAQTRCTWHGLNPHWLMVGGQGAAQSSDINSRKSFLPSATFSLPDVTVIETRQSHLVLIRYFHARGVTIS